MSNVCDARHSPVRADEVALQWEHQRRLHRKALESAGAAPASNSPGREGPKPTIISVL